MMKKVYTDEKMDRVRRVLDVIVDYIDQEHLAQMDLDNMTQFGDNGFLKMLDISLEQFVEALKYIKTELGLDTK